MASNDPGDGTVRYPSLPPESSPSSASDDLIDMNKVRKEANRRRRHAKAEAAKQAKAEREFDVLSLNSEKIAELSAQRAISGLVTPPKSPSSVQEQREVLAENLKILVDGTTDPVKLIEAARAEEEDVKNHGGHGDNAVNVSDGQGGDSTRPVLYNWLGRKRIVSDPRKKRGRESSPDGRQHKKTWYKRSSPGPDIVALNAQPTQLVFPPHVDGRNDQWFEDEFQRLYKSVRLYFDMYFGREDLDDDDQPWAEDFGDEFLNFAEQVAEADPQTGWDVIIKDGKQRRYLFVGILWTVLEKKIFDELLFGATDVEKEALFATERAMISSEGKLGSV